MKFLIYRNKRQTVSQVTWYLKILFNKIKCLQVVGRRNTCSYIKHCKKYIPAH